MACFFSESSTSKASRPGQLLEERPFQRDRNGKPVDSQRSGVQPKQGGEDA